MKPRPCSSQAAGGFFAHADEESPPRSFGQYSVAGGPRHRRPSPPAGGGFRPSAGGSPRWGDAEAHFAVGVIDLNPADDGMDDLRHAEQVEPVQTVTHLGGKILQSADDE